MRLVRASSTAGSGCLSPTFLHRFALHHVFLLCTLFSRTQKQGAKQKTGAKQRVPEPFTRSVIFFHNVRILPSTLYSCSDSGEAYG